MCPAANFCCRRPCHLDFSGPPFCASQRPDRLQHPRHELLAGPLLKRFNLSTRPVRRSLNSRHRCERNRRVDTQDGAHHYRLDCNRRLSAAQFVDQPVLPPPFVGQHRRIFRIRTKCFLVARGHLHGGHHLCRRHTAAGRRLGSQKRNLRELAVVVAMSVRHDDRVFLRPLLASRGNSHRR